MKITIVLFDGECNFCNTWICFLKSKLQKNEISFIAFKSIEGIKTIEKYKLKNQNSIAYIENDTVFFKSRAVSKICKQLKFPYNLLQFLKIIPKFMLDFAYDFIAKRRLKLTSKKQFCNG